MIWLYESPLGQLLANTIGKFIWDVIHFLAPYLEFAMDLFIQALIIVTTFAVFFITSFMFMKLVNFFILISQGRGEEAVEMLNITTSAIIGKISGGKFGG